MIADLWQLLCLNLAIRYREYTRTAPYGEQLIEAMRTSWQIR